MTRPQMTVGILGALPPKGSSRHVTDIKAFNGWAQTVLIGWVLTNLVRQGVIQRVRRGWYQR